MCPSDKLLYKGLALLAVVLLICTVLPPVIFTVVPILIMLVAWLNNIYNDRNKQPEFVYKEYLRSPEWKLIRDRIVARDNYECTVCSSKIMLQVHHLTYERIGKELPSDLVTLCSFCHKKVHNISTS